ncbi:hypothetical protein E0485_11050 [Paenibacillus albiflavus]|uniref:Glycosyltransferase subfamily 4-like N-terminal domain-containing protein n=1 Tax=Paenibacillus albiflavus TaxID=2545760 RepID=A0A4R4EEK6_9BACL|nr:glycosyltransferase [Paenibacillus albiflavus]TCZ77520.1 hypothetical protein E0485_11050 [Paenibacillus albiflavus]
MRILLISYFFPPYNTIGAVRTGKMAKYLAKMGNEVYVLSAKNQPLQPSLSLEIPHDQVAYTNWMDVNKPVQFLLGGRAKIADRGYIPPKGILRKTFKFFGHSYKTLVNFPDGQVGWVPYAIKEGARKIREWQPDIIYASAMPYSSLLIAKKLSTKFNIPWVAEFRDLWVDYQYYHYGFLRKKLEAWLERSTLITASGYITVSEPLAETLRKKYNSKPTKVIMNGFDLEDYPEENKRDQETISSQDHVLRILYTGMVYEGKEDPSPLFKALHLLGDNGDHVRVVFYGRYLDTVRELAKRYHVEHLIEINSPVSYTESIQLQCNADVLLLLLWNDPMEKGIYSGKLFEYIGARRPILAIGSEDNVAADLVRERNVGVVQNDEMRIAELLLEWIKQKQIAPIPDKPIEAAMGLSREVQAEQLQQFLRSVLQMKASVKQLAQHGVVPNE